VTGAKYNYDDKIKEVEVVRACSTHGFRWENQKEKDH
jgi:hypothetical protein